MDGSDKNLSLSVSQESVSVNSIGTVGNDSPFATIPEEVKSLTEEECSKRRGFTCEKANTKVCIHSDLRCNEHPDCDDASDEKSCEEKNPLGGFRCPSPHHNKENKDTFTPWVTIFATRCDLNPECWGGVDEQGCNNDWAVYYVIGKTFQCV